jgi:hypothetical protein
VVRVAGERLGGPAGFNSRRGRVAQTRSCSSSSSLGPKCPPGTWTSRASGRWPANHWPCACGTSASSSATMTVTGQTTAARSIPHGRVSASSSSNTPPAPGTRASENASTNMSRSRTGMSVLVLRESTHASISSWARSSSWSAPDPIARHSSASSGSIPSKKSRSLASKGPRPTIVAQRVTRSGSPAATARAWGPPAETPTTANSTISRCSAIARTSSAASRTRRPGRRLDLPYPGRSYVITRSPFRSHSPLTHRSSRLPGLPCRKKSGRPS